MTTVVSAFMNDLKSGQSLITATWDDVDHLDEKTKDQLLAVYSPAERDMRSKGIPVFGSGLVFPVSEEDIVCEDFDLPEHFPGWLQLTLALITLLPSVGSHLTQTMT